MKKDYSASNKRKQKVFSNHQKLKYFQIINLLMLAHYAMEDGSNVGPELI